MRGNKFNLLGALNGEVRKAQAGEKVKPREVNMDPNRLSWPYLKVSELKKDVAYTMNLLLGKLPKEKLKIYSTMFAKT